MGALCPRLASVILQWARRAQMTNEISSPPDEKWSSGQNGHRNGRLCRFAKPVVAQYLDPETLLDPIDQGHFWRRHQNVR